MREKIRAAVAQIEILSLDPAKNLEKMKAYCERAKQEKADLVVFPELASSGYIQQRSRDFGREIFKKAEPIPGPTTDALGGVAKRLGLQIIAGICERHPEISGMMYNSAALILPDGHIGGVHRKIHIPGEEKHFFCAGNTIQAFQTDLGKIGILICYDLWFAEICRMYALQGAEILCAPFNAPLTACPPSMLESVSATRAIENRLYVVSCNCVGKYASTAFFGGSAIADPFGSLIAHCGEDRQRELLLAGDLTYDKVLEERSWQPTLKDRRPELYKALVEPL